MIGICDDLRKAVLQAAIQGKLTEQLASDGDAETLYAEIQQEKQKLIAEKKIKKEKPLEHIDSDEVPFDIPENWKWVRLGDLGEYRKGPFGSSLTKSMFVPKSADSIKVYEQKNAIKKDYSIGDYFISFCKFKEMKSFEVLPGDIIVSCAGTIGEAYLLPKEAPKGIINQALMRVRLFNKHIMDFWLIYFDYILKKQAKLNSSGTAIKNIPPFDVLKSFCLPLPPLAEQHRIVAKVDELMAKIDEMEKTEKSLTDLYNAFSGDMKASLLQAAIQGKLTEQLASDGDAETLYAEIQQEKQKLIKEGKIKKEKELKSVDSDEVPFDIPKNWKWVRLSDLSANVKIPFADGPFGSNLKSCHYTNKKEVRIIQLSNIGEDGWKDKNTKYTTYEHLKTIERSSVNAGDIVIAKMMPAGRAICVPNIENSFVLSSDAVKFVPHPLLEKRYLLHAINSNCFKSQIYEGVQGITRVRTSLQKLKTYLIPLPPIAEQKRIVEKLDQLLPLCDSMKEAIDAN